MVPTTLGTYFSPTLAYSPSSLGTFPWSPVGPRALHRWHPARPPHEKAEHSALYFHVFRATTPAGSDAVWGCRRRSPPPPCLHAQSLRLRHRCTCTSVTRPRCARHGRRHAGTAFPTDTPETTPTQWPMGMRMVRRRWRMQSGGRKYDHYFSVVSPFLDPVNSQQLSLEFPTLDITDAYNPGPPQHLHTDEPATPLCGGLWV